MPFIRQSRDKRGFENTYVMHAGRPGAGVQRPKVLYLFRSPAHLKVGRQPLDPEVREALEHTHPDLNFDWNALTREAVVARPEAAQSRPARAARPAIEDESLAGRILGAAAAARIRARYAEVTQRISRRARTPEERDALLEKARALDVDAWPDEATVRSRAGTIERDLERLAAELPSRRRGRRGGRNRSEEGASGHSGIMARSDDQLQDSRQDASEQGPDGPDLSDRQADSADAGGGAGVGPADPEADLPIDD